MGDIFRATDGELRRVVAIKVLSERYASDPQVRERFRREALAAARLSSNPHIVTIFDVAEAGTGPMIVMEYLPGGSLEDRVRGRAPCPTGRVLDWLDEAAAALDAAHAAGVVHRDVKPANLLLDEHERIKVADFGVASAAGLESFTQTGTIIGTAGYLSPEQAGGERATGASDRYSLAVVAWELLVGRRPFEASSPTAEAAAHIQAPIPSVHEANRSLPPALDAVFRRALAKDPATRHPSAAELVGDLRRAIHDAAGETAWDAHWPIPAPGRTPLAARAGPARARRSRGWIALPVAILAAAGVAAAVIATRDDRSTPAAPPPVTRTITTPQVTRTVTTSAQAQVTTAGTGGDGADLNDEGYRKMQAHDFAGALPLLEAATQALSGSGQLDEAYADFNLAFTRFALGDCTDVLALLDRAQAIEGVRAPIDQLRARARRRC